MLRVVLELSECFLGLIKLANKERLMFWRKCWKMESPNLESFPAYLSWERSGAGRVNMSDVQSTASRVLLERYAVGKPRAIREFSMFAIILTDETCENIEKELTATIGGILYLPGSPDPFWLSRWSRCVTALVWRWKTTPRGLDSNVCYMHCKIYLE